MKFTFESKSGSEYPIRYNPKNSFPWEIHRIYTIASEEDFTIHEMNWRPIIFIQKHLKYGVQRIYPQDIFNPLLFLGNSVHHSTYSDDFWRLYHTIEKTNLNQNVTHLFTEYLKETNLLRKTSPLVKIIEDTKKELKEGISTHHRTPNPEELIYS
ncbi:MAG: hypothetical protein ACOCXG_01665 [Nanoarchaeota archaeon]